MVWPRPQAGNGVRGYCVVRGLHGLSACHARVRETCYSDYTKKQSNGSQPSSFVSAPMQSNGSQLSRGLDDASLEDSKPVSITSSSVEDSFDSSKLDTKELRISGIGGSLCTIDAHITWTISEVKDKIAELIHIPKYKQCLLLDLDELQNTDMVRELVGDPFVQLCLVRRSIEAFLKPPSYEPDDDGWTFTGSSLPLWLAVKNNEFSPQQFNPHCSSTNRAGCSVNSMASESQVRNGALQPRLESVDVALKAVRRDGMVLQHAQSWIQDDKNVVLAAVRQNGLALEYASPALKDDPAIVLEAIASDVGAHRLASDRIKQQWKILSSCIDPSTEVELQIYKKLACPKWCLAARLGSQLLRTSWDFSEDR